MFSERDLALNRKWLDFLLKDEFTFHEEAHLLGSGEKRVICIPQDAYRTGAGWFLTWSDMEAGEWNLAQAFGKTAEAVAALVHFPADVPFQLLVPWPELDEFMRLSGLKPAEKLIWHKSQKNNQNLKSTNKNTIENVPSPRKAMTNDSQNPFQNEPFALKAVHEEPVGPFHWPLKEYLLKENSVVCLVKSIHATPNTVEVYIETSPEIRDQGAGTFLLQEVLARVQAHHRTMIYVTSESNLPSLRVAAKSGLKPYREMARIGFCRKET